MKTVRKLQYYIYIVAEIELGSRESKERQHIHELV